MILPEFDRGGARHCKEPMPDQEENHYDDESDIEDQEEVQILVVLVL